MSRNNLPEDWDMQEHPSLEVLRQYQAGELSAPQSHQLERHLLSCEMCSDLVEGMSLSQPYRVKSAVRETRGRLKNFLAQKKRKRKVFQWPAWQTAAVLLVLLFAIGEVVYHQFFANHNHFQTTTGETEKAWRLTGRVEDNNGQTVSGATIQVVGGKTKTTTNQGGGFELEIQSQKSRIMVSHPDFSTKEVEVNSSSPQVNITLEKAE
ncbi:carboxypeptidase-like regulatory domain-containing protein [Rufibacter aurantiacus]|uniref:carboxypeptidase-like regulatory domain-containing protein n=1 Tax=Rufibacter aurantiacus TaxID=2817374 RepID=UPI001B318755|nr:carboxypeptidase-like regulatory domain-containing protein [Rufibacter aurantiacus]